MALTADRTEARRGVRIAGVGLLLATAVFAARLAGSAGEPRVVDVRAGRHPGFVRLVFETDAPADFTLEPGAGPQEVRVRLGASSAPRVLSAPGSPETTVRLEPTPGGDTLARIRSAIPVQVESQVLGQPPRIVLDLRAAAPQEAGSGAGGEPVPERATEPAPPPAGSAGGEAQVREEEPMAPEAAEAAMGKAEAGGEPSSPPAPPAPQPEEAPRAEASADGGAPPPAGALPDVSAPPPAARPAPPAAEAPALPEEDVPIRPPLAFPRGVAPTPRPSASEAAPPAPAAGTVAAAGTRPASGLIPGLPPIPGVPAVDTGSLAVGVAGGLLLGLLLVLLVRSARGTPRVREAPVAVVPSQRAPAEPEPAREAPPAQEEAAVAAASLGGTTGEAGAAGQGVSPAPSAPSELTADVLTMIGSLDRRFAAAERDLAALRERTERIVERHAAQAEELAAQRVALARIDRALQRRARPAPAPGPAARPPV